MADINVTTAGIDDPWMDVATAAAHAGGLNTATIQRAMKARRLRAVKINGGRIWRTRRSWIDCWLLAGDPDARAAKATREAA